MAALSRTAGLGAAASDVEIFNRIGKKAVAGWPCGRFGAGLAYRGMRCSGVGGKTMLRPGSLTALRQLLSIRASDSARRSSYHQSIRTHALLAQLRT